MNNTAEKKFPVEQAVAIKGVTQPMNIGCSISSHGQAGQWGISGVQPHISVNENRIGDQRQMQGAQDYYGQGFGPRIPCMPPYGSPGHHMDTHQQNMPTPPTQEIQGYRQHHGFVRPDRNNAQVTRQPDTQNHIGQGVITDVPRPQDMYLPERSINVQRQMQIQNVHAQEYGPRMTNMPSHQSAEQLQLPTGQQNMPATPTREIQKHQTSDRFLQSDLNHTPISSQPNSQNPTGQGGITRAPQNVYFHEMINIQQKMQITKSHGQEFGTQMVNRPSYRSAEQQPPVHQQNMPATSTQEIQKHQKGHRFLQRDRNHAPIPRQPNTQYRAGQDVITDAPQKMYVREGINIQQQMQFTKAYGQEFGPPMMNLPSHRSGEQQLPVSQQNMPATSTQEIQFQTGHRFVQPDRNHAWISRQPYTQNQTGQYVNNDVRQNMYADERRINAQRHVQSLQFYGQNIELRTTRPSHREQQNMPTILPQKIQEHQQRSPSYGSPGHHMLTHQQNRPTPAAQEVQGHRQRYGFVEPHRDHAQITSLPFTDQDHNFTARDMSNFVPSATASQHVSTSYIADQLSIANREYSTILRDLAMPTKTNSNTSIQSGRFTSLQNTSMERGHEAAIGEVKVLYQRNPVSLENLHAAQLYLSQQTMNLPKTVQTPDAELSHASSQRPISALIPTPQTAVNMMQPPAISTTPAVQNMTKNYIGSTVHHHPSNNMPERIRRKRKISRATAPSRARSSQLLNTTRRGHRYVPYPSVKPSGSGGLRQNSETCEAEKKKIFEELVSEVEQFDK